MGRCLPACNCLCNTAAAYAFTSSAAAAAGTAAAGTGGYAWDSLLRQPKRILYPCVHSTVRPPQVLSDNEGQGRQQEASHSKCDNSAEAVPGLHRRLELHCCVQVIRKAEGFGVGQAACERTHASARYRRRGRSFVVHRFGANRNLWLIFRWFSKPRMLGRTASLARRVGTAFVAGHLITVKPQK